MRGIVFSVYHLTKLSTLAAYNVTYKGRIKMAPIILEYAGCKEEDDLSAHEAHVVLNMSELAARHVSARPAVTVDFLVTLSF